MATRPLWRTIASIIPQTSADALDGRVRRTLVRTLYTQPSTLAIGAINGIVTSCVAAYLSGSDLLGIASLVLTAIAVIRVGAAYAMSAEEDGQSTVLVEVTYEIGAFSYALALGAIAAISVASVRLAINTALAATVITSSTGRPLIMPPLLSASKVIATMSTRNTRNISRWLWFSRVDREPTRGMLVAR